MRSDLQQQITELQEAYSELNEIEVTGTETIISGLLCFSAAPKDLENICETFSIRIHVPNNYPTELPHVIEVGGKVEKAFSHLNDDNTLCLAVPMEMRRIFKETPTLLGFVEKLVIPYLYGYVYQQKHGTMPFGEAPHGNAGVLEYYRELFNPTNDLALLKGLYGIYQHGYRGHHSCPCGSGIIIRKCHKDTVLWLTDQSNKTELMRDLCRVLDSYQNPEA